MNGSESGFLLQHLPILRRQTRGSSPTMRWHAFSALLRRRSACTPSATWGRRRSPSKFASTVNASIRRSMCPRDPRNDAAAAPDCVQRRLAVSDVHVVRRPHATQLAFVGRLRISPQGSATPSARETPVRLELDDRGALGPHEVALDRHLGDKRVVQSHARNLLRRVPSGRPRRRCRRAVRDSLGVGC